MYIYSHNPHSRGAKALAKHMGIKRIKHNGSKFKGHFNKTVINWGAIEIPQQVMYCNVINSPGIMEFVIDKWMFFNLVKFHKTGVRIPPYTTDIEHAAQWIAKGYKVVERHLLRGSGGRGIRIVTSEEALKEAPMYTKYIKKKDEYRIHIFRGNIFDIQKKGLRNGVVNPDWYIRNHDNGFIYMREGIDMPFDVGKQAVNAFNCTGLDFGAVDVIWNDHKQKAYVLEINTAPGLEGTTLENYSKIFLENLEE